jgi:predicted RNA-binding protein YlxR (DUF448 family)
MEKKVKKIPLRQCMGCNEHKPKPELLRVVRTPEGEVTLDFTGKKNGRGAYLCKDVKCLRKARKTGRIARVLECEIGEGVYDAMEEALTAELDGHA